MNNGRYRKMTTEWVNLLRSFRIIVSILGSLALLVGLSSAAAGTTGEDIRPQSGSLNIVFNDHTGRCLDASYSFGIRSYPCNGSVYQEWIVFTADGGYTRTLMNNATGWCLVDNAAGVGGVRCNGQEATNWLFSWGNYALQNTVTLRCLDDSFSYGLRTLSCNGLNYQKWILSPA